MKRSTQILVVVVSLLQAGIAYAEISMTDSRVIAARSLLEKKQSPEEIRVLLLEKDGLENDIREARRSAQKSLAGKTEDERNKIWQNLSGALKDKQQRLREISVKLRDEIKARQELELQKTRKK
jgi:hypothetical protein